MIKSIKSNHVTCKLEDRSLRFEVWITLTSVSKTKVEIKETLSHEITAIFKRLKKMLLMYSMVYVDVDSKTIKWIK